LVLEQQVAPPPWCRLQGSEAGKGVGTFGFNGARIEQFAIGSVLYMMTRGREPYDDGHYPPGSGPIIVGLLKDMQFPLLEGNNHLDAIINRCWRSKYPSLKDLAEETKSLPGAMELPRATVLSEDVFAKAKAECEEFVRKGLEWSELPDIKVVKRLV
jgi:hypothetical protein